MGSASQVLTQEHLKGRELPLTVLNLSDLETWNPYPGIFSQLSTISNSSDLYTLQQLTKGQPLEDLGTQRDSRVPHPYPWKT